jgi:hypothetical protein
MLIRVLFLFTIWNLPDKIICQTHSLSLGGGIQLEGLLEAAYSPLKYSGTGYQGGISYCKSSEKKDIIWLLTGGSSQLSNQFKRDLKTTSIRLVNYNLYHRNQSNSKFKFGWSNNNGFYTRQIDDFSNFNGRTDFFTTFGPAVSYTLPLSIKQKRFTFQTVAHTQIIGFYVPSSYVASLPRGFGYEQNSFLAAIWKSAHLFHPGAAWNGGLWSKFDWHLWKQNTIGINYIYEYTNFSKPESSKRSTGTWFISLILELTYDKE